MKVRWLAVASYAIAACATPVQLGDHDAGPADAGTDRGGSSSGAGDAAASCDGSASTVLSVDVFNTNLGGSSAPAYAAREQVLTDAQNSPIGKRDSDVMCLVGVDFGPDITKIVAGFPPYSYWVKTSVSTPFTNPDTQDGSVPPPPAAAPCGASVPSNDVNQVFQCMIQNCNTLPGNPSGNLPGSSDCLSSNCSAPFAQLLLNKSYNACFDCIIDYVVSDQPYGASQTACMNNAQAPFGYGGQVPVVILSRYPLTDTDAFILPSTDYRRAVLFSRVQLHSCKTVDFYCGSFTSTLIAQDEPYTGNYGAGGDPNSTSSGGAYANEQILQAQRLAAAKAICRQRSGSPASRRR